MSTEHYMIAQDFLIRYGGDNFGNLFSKAKGTLVWDDQGRQILDFTSGQMCATIGHNHPSIVKAVEEAGEKAYHFFSGMIPEVVSELAETLAKDWMPEPLRRSLLVTTGSESNEAALRIAKMYTDGFEIIAVGGSWHGVTGGASASSYASDRRGYGIPVAGVFAIPEPNSYRPYIPGSNEEESAMACLDLGFKMFDMQSSGKPAAIIIEPIISAGGVLVPPKCFMEGLRKAADERNMLLIFDEAQTAFGRIGYKTGAEFHGVTPDIMSVSKTIGGGLPLAGVITTNKIEEKVHEKGFTYYTSHVSDPLPAYVGLAVLKAINEESLIERARTMGQYLLKKLINLQQKYEAIGDIRGEGLLLGVELVKDRENREPFHQLGKITTEHCFKNGLSMNIRRRKERGSVWRIAPPLTVSYDEIDQAIDILDLSLRESLDEITRLKV
jgi:2,2-dialkylglycine decarboxylase (pyruvate)